MCFRLASVGGDRSVRFEIYGEARGGGFKGREVVVDREAEVYGSVLGYTVVVAKNASVERVVGKQVRVGKGAGRLFGGRGGCCRGFGNGGFVSVFCEAGLSSEAGTGETRKIDLPSLPLDSSFQRPSKSEAFGNSEEKQVLSQHCV
jgi:hypothetical protein